MQYVSYAYTLNFFKLLVVKTTSLSDSILYSMSPFSVNRLTLYICHIQAVKQLKLQHGDRRCTS